MYTLPTNTYILPNDTPPVWISTEIFGKYQAHFLPFTAATFTCNSDLLQLLPSYPHDS